MRRILVVDYSEISYMGLFAWRKARTLTFEYFLLRKLFSVIKKFPEREIFLTADGTQNWRKQVLPSYKSGRKSFRESYPDIDWDHFYTNRSVLLSHLAIYTPIQVLQDDCLESDDLIAVMAKLNPDVDIIAVTSDKDMNQLYVYPNFKVASPRSPTLAIRVVTNPQLELQKLIDKGDRIDDVPMGVTEGQKIINTKLVDLLHLPEFVEKRAHQVLTSQGDKSVNLEAFCSKYQYKFLPEELKRL